MHSLAPASTSAYSRVRFIDVYKLIYGIQMGTLDFSSDFRAAGWHSEEKNSFCLEIRLETYRATHMVRWRAMRMQIVGLH